MTNLLNELQASLVVGALKKYTDVFDYAFGKTTWEHLIKILNERGGSECM